MTQSRTYCCQTHSIALFIDLFPQQYFFRMRVIIATTVNVNAMMRITVTTDPPMMAAVEEDASECKKSIVGS